MFVLCLLYKDNSIEHKVTWRTEGFKSTNKKIPGLSMWTNWDWDRFFPENFTFPLSVLFHRCSITRINETINHLYHRVAQWASRLRYVCSICCGALHKKKLSVRQSYSITKSCQLRMDGLDIFVVSVWLLGNMWSTKFPLGTLFKELSGPSAPYFTLWSLHRKDQSV
jgi:hypothetical protein